MMKYAAFLFLCGILSCLAAEPPDVVFNRAAQALAAGDYTAAEQGFQAVLRQEPGNVGAIGNLGIIYARTNRADKAITAYQSALHLSPNDEPILLNLGIVYLKQEFHALALPYFARVVTIDPGNRQARQLLAVCRLYTGEVTSAIHDLQELRAASPRDEQILFLLGFAYLKNGDPKTAQTVFNDMFEVAGPARTQFLLGKASYEAALFPQAEESFLEVLRLDPNFPTLHLELGKLYISQRRTEDAIRELKVALKENPANEDANYFLGSLLVRESHYAEGITYLEQARKLKPDSWAVYFYLGRAKLHLEQTEEAVTLLRRAVELSPDDANAQYQLGRALQADGQKLAATRAFGRARDLKAGALNEINIPGVR
ncbi:MAG: tetratricopeptide repeat protein [Acidobacteriaceae bacterium]|nr:tetratricopeptide repeat protein [Acidobacteriaceae bacterium]